MIRKNLSLRLGWIRVNNSSWQTGFCVFNQAFVTDLSYHGNTMYHSLFIIQWNLIFFLYILQKEIKDRNATAISTRNRLHERRMQSARSRHYYDEYQVRMRSKMLKRRTKEEMVSIYVRINCAENMLFHFLVSFFLWKSYTCFGLCKGINKIMLNPCLCILSFMLSKCLF